MLAGRDGDVGAVLEVVDGLRAGRGASLAVLGEPGVGKTALLEHVLPRCAGLRVVELTGHEGESALPYSGLLTLARPLREVLPVLTGPAREALGQALGLVAGAAPTPFAVAGATLELLAAAAASGPVLLVVDDLHLVDAQSVASLLFALRRLHDEAVGAVLAARSSDRMLRLLAGTPVLLLPGLGLPEARALLQVSVGGLAEPVVEALVAFTGGNPLALREMAAALDADQRTGRRPVAGALRTGADVVARFGEHLAGLPDGTRALLLVLALEPDADPALLDGVAVALDLPVDAHVPALHAGLVRPGPGGLRLAHPTVRRAALEAATRERRRRTHLAIAGVLAARGSRQRRAWHLAAAATGPDAEVCAEVEGAGLRALEHGDLTMAARLLGRACELAPRAADRDRLRLAAGVAATQVGAPGGLEQLESLSMSEAAEDLREAADLQLARVSAWTGDAAAVYRAAARTTRATTPAVAAQLHGIATAVAWTRFERDEMDHHAATVRRLLLGLDPPPVHPVVTLALADLVVGTPDVAGLARTAHRFLLDPVVDLAAPLAVTLLAHGLLVETGTVVDRCLAEARQTRALPAVAWLQAVRCALLTVRGDLAGAVAAGREAVDLGDVLGAGLAGAQGRAWLALALAATGDERGCRAVAAEGVAAAAPLGSHSTVAYCELALARLDLAHGRWRAAVGRTLALGEQLRRRGMVCDAVVPVLPDAVEAAVRAGEAAQAETLLRGLESEVERTGLAGSRAWALHGRALLAPDASAEAAFEAALDARTAVPDPLAHARTLLALGEHRRARRRHREAREVLQQAEATFRQAGATPWADRARRQLVAAGGVVPRQGRPAEHDLTPQERQVAELAATGASTRDLAAALFVSPKTVETHLTRVYRKLGVRGRAELAHRFAGLEPVPGAPARDLTVGRAAATAGPPPAG